VTDDASLISATLAGDTNAFGRLVRKYQDRLFTTMVHVTGRAEEAEDVVQEAFVQAFLKLENFQGRSAFYTWLYRIAFNVSASRRRKRRPEMSVEQIRMATGQEPADDSPGAIDELERAERTECLRAALDELTEEHKGILMLRELEGCCYETIAEVLQLPVGTVRSRLHRARNQLREVLERKQQKLY
jgi:RNA polymerase sigma-70 factor (ECF subfamily)